MQKKSVFTKILAIAGTALVCFPLLAPVLLSAVVTIRAHTFHFDFLMPAELFPVVLSGGGLLIWAALRARAHRRLIGWCLGIAAGLLVGGQALAVVTGLASGETEPAGVWWALVLASLVVYVLAIIGVGVGGVLLLRSIQAFQVSAMTKRPLSVTAALGFVLLNAVVWLALAIIIAANLHPALPDLPLVKGIMAFMAFAMAFILLGLFALLGKRSRMVYFLSLAFLAATAFATIFDDFGLTDLVVVIINIVPVVLLIKDRAWYLPVKSGSVGT